MLTFKLHLSLSLEEERAELLGIRKIPESRVIPVAAADKKSSLFHITRQFYSFLGGCLTYLTIQLYFDGVQTRRMPKQLSVN